MPLTHERTFRVRYTDCSTHGLARLASFLRYMQEAAFEASAAAGYDLPRYESMGSHWLIRETEAEFSLPLRYGDLVLARTWVADFRRVRSRRAYEFRLADSGDLVAHGSTDWVFLDSTSHLPVAMPAEMMAAFFPEGVPPRAPARARFRSTLPPPGALRQQRTVEWRDIDQAGHVNNAVYADYLEDCDAQALAAHGWSVLRLQHEGWLPLARRLQIEYHQPAFLRDELELATWISDSASEAVLRNCRMTRVHDGALLAHAQTAWAGVDAGTGQWAPIPAALRLDLGPDGCGGVVGGGRRS